jgi:hypothetical protein
MKKPKTIRDQIMLLPDPLNHLCIEMFVMNNHKDKLDNPAYTCWFSKNSNDYATPIGETNWHDYDLMDLRQAIAFDAIHHKLWEVKP